MAGPRQVLRGIAASPGVAVGSVCLFGSGQLYVPRRYVDRADLTDEAARLRAAIDGSRSELEALRGRLGSAEQRLVIDAQMLMHSDALLIDGAIELLRERSINAEWALVQTVTRLADQMRGAVEPYFRERAGDIEHVGERILRKLAGVAAELPTIPHGGVIVADDLGPADAAQLLRSVAAGIATELGSATSHTAILARALDIPAVVGLPNLTSLAGDQAGIILDGFRGEVVLWPSEEEQQRARARGERFRAFMSSLRVHGGPAAVTRDGTSLQLEANVELPAEAALAVQEGATGIGLYRTEFLFLDRQISPSEEEQSKVYCDVVQVMAPRRVVFRTFDIGGDRLHGEGSAAELVNPALGLRAIRRGLQSPTLLRTQLRAILRATPLGCVHVMFPLVTGLEELRAARALWDEARAELEFEGVPVGAARLGVMIETPAAVMIADLLAPHCDFFSVGTNDLVQYTLAVDRSNPAVAHMSSPLHPAVLRMLAQTQEAAAQAGIELSMCGGMVSDPIALPLVLGLGYTNLSVDLAHLPLVRAAAAGIDLAVAQQTVLEALAAPTVADVRALVISRFQEVLGELWREQGVQTDE